MSRGRKRGHIEPETLAILPKVREFRARGLTYDQIAPLVGRHRTRIYQLCKKFSITCPSRRKHPRRPDKRGKWRGGPLPQIDPEKARQITEAKKRYWGFAA